MRFVGKTYAKGNAYFLHAQFFGKKRTFFKARHFHIVAAFGCRRGTHHSAVIFTVKTADLLM